VDVVPHRSSSVLERLFDELVGGVQVLDRHELLMELDLLVDVRSGDSNQLSDVFQNNASKRHIFPEKARFQVQSNLLPIFVNRDHWKYHVLVTLVRGKYLLEGRGVRDLSLVHKLNALFNGHNHGEVNARILLEERLFYRLDLVVKELNLVRGVIVDLFVEERHLALVEGRLHVPVLEEGVHSSWMDNLV